MSYIHELFTRFSEPKRLKEAVQTATTMGKSQLAFYQQRFQNTLIGTALDTVAKKAEKESRVSASEIGKEFYARFTTFDKAPSISLQVHELPNGKELYGFGVHPTKGESFRPKGDIPREIVEAVNEVKELVGKYDPTLITEKGNLVGEVCLLPEIEEGTYIVLREGSALVQDTAYRETGSMQARKFTLVANGQKKEFPTLFLLRDSRDEAAPERMVFMPEMPVPDAWFEYDYRLSQAEREALPIIGGQPTVYGHLPEGLADGKFTPTRRS